MITKLGMSLAVLFVTEAVAEPIQSHSTRTWTSRSACWATVWPTVSLLADEFGLSRLNDNSSERVEHEVIDSVTGRTVMRVGCMRVPGTAMFLL